jgi:hypothetical protein
MNSEDRTGRGPGESSDERQKSPTTWAIAMIGFAIVLGVLIWGLVGNSDKGMTSRPNTGNSETVGSAAGPATQAAPAGSSGTPNQPTQNPGPPRTNR